MSAGDPVLRPGPMENDVLAGSASERHRRALGDLAKDHHRALVRYLTARTGSVEEAKEVAQETYARALELDRPQAVGFLVGYIWKIAGNLVLERRRNRVNRARLDRIALTQPHESSVPLPDSLLYTEQQLQLVEEALDQLPPKCIQAFVLRIVQEQSFKEVARQMSISERMAKMYVARAAQFCQSYLDGAEAARRMPK